MSIFHCFFEFFDEACFVIDLVFFWELGYDGICDGCKYFGEDVGIFFEGFDVDVYFVISVVIEAEGYEKFFVCKVHLVILFYV